MALFNFKIKKNLEKLKEAHNYIDYLYANDRYFEILIIFKKRTLKQNAYLHVIFGLIASETGFTLDEVKDLFKKAFLTYSKYGKKFTRRTSKLNTEKINKFIEQIRNYCNIELGIYIPEPHEEEKLNALREDLKKYEEFIGSINNY